MTMATAMKTSPENISVCISFVPLCDYFNSLNFYKKGELSRNQIACVASVSVLFPSKDGAKNGTSKRGGRFISRAAKTENLVPRSFFSPKQHGNACYAG